MKIYKSDYQDAMKKLANAYIVTEKIFHACDDLESELPWETSNHIVDLMNYLKKQEIIMDN